MKQLTYAVLGAGNGGQCIYAYLKLKGYQVSLYDRYEAVLEPIKKRGGIQLTGVSLNGFADAKLVTSDIAQAVRGADVIMVVLPSFAHSYIAEQLSAVLVDGQTVILCPGSTGGVLEFKKVLADKACTAKIKLAETNSLFYASRIDASGSAVISAIKSQMPLAALPSSDADEIINMLKDPYPQIVKEQNVLVSDMSNLNAVVHPTPVLLNTGWIEATGGNYKFYYDSITPSVGRVIELVDAERVAVCKAFGFEIKTLIESMSYYYGADADTLSESVRKVEGYAIISGPPKLETRLILEDVPMGAVPMAELAKIAGVQTPMMNMIIDLACAVLNRDFRAEGRTLKRLGIDGMSKDELLAYIH